MVDMLFDLLSSVATARPYSNPYCEWDKWLARASAVTPQFTHKRVSEYFGKKKSNIYDELRATVTNARAYDSATLGSTINTPQRYVGFDPGRATEDYGRRQMIEAEMRLHLHELQSQFENQRQELANMQNQLQQQAYGSIGASGISGSAGASISPHNTTASALQMAREVAETQR